MDRIKSFLLYKIFRAVKDCFALNLKRTYSTAKEIGSIINAHYYEKRLGIETSEGRIEKDSWSKNGDGHVYFPTPYGLLEKMAAYLKLDGNDVFVDLGCGKGRVVIFAAKQKVKAVIGVELKKSLADIAKTNLSNLKSSLDDPDSTRAKSLP